MIKTIVHFLFYLFLVSGPASFSPTFAQTASILPPAKTQFLDDNGNPLSSGHVYNYIVGTGTFKNTWQDSTESTLNTNPVTLDAGGRALIYGQGAYRQVVKKANGDTVYDAITSSTGSGGGSASTGDGDLVGTIKPWAGITAPSQYVFAYGQELSRTTYSSLLTAITLVTTVICTSASNTISGISDTTTINVGSPVEGTCIPSGTTVVSKTASSVLMSNPATITINAAATFFPFGNGNGTTTFNVPDLRGYIIAGRDNMGGTSAARLTTTYFGANSPDAQGATGGAQSNTIAQTNLPVVTLSTAIAAGQGSHTHTGTTTAPNFASAGTAGAGNGLTSGTATIAIAAATLPAMTGTTPLGGSGTAISRIQPTITLSYIIKITPDTNSSVATGVTDIQGMTGSISCGTGLSCTGNIINTADNSVVNRIFIKDGQPWADIVAWGAVADGVTDNSASIQAAVDYMLANYVGGIIFIPPVTNAAYCVFSAINVTGGSSISSIRFVGATSSSSIISACGHDITVFNINRSQSGIEHLFVIGKGAGVDTGTFGANHPTIEFGTGCVQCKLVDVTALGGSVTVELQAADIFVSDSHFSQGYGAAIARVTQGMWFLRNAFDQNWPFTLPSGLGSSISAWTGTHVYVAGDLVTNAGYVMQATVGGTSGGSLPTLKNYNVNITDGSVTWQIAMPVNYASMQIDTNGQEVQIMQSDFTGSFYYGISLVNTLAGTIPAYVAVTDSVISQMLVTGFNASVGNGLFVNGSHMSAGILSNGECVTLGPSWGGNFGFNNNTCGFGVGAVGIHIRGGTDANIVNNRFGGLTTAAIQVAANVNQFTITGNSLGTSPGAVGGANNYAVIIDAGTSNNFTIVGNDISGATQGASAIANSSTPATGQIIIANSGYATNYFGTDTIQLNGGAAWQFTAGTGHALQLIAPATIQFIAPLVGVPSTTNARFQIQSGDAAHSANLEFNNGTDLWTFGEPVSATGIRLSLSGTGDLFYFSKLGGFGVGTATDPGAGGIIAGSVTGTTLMRTPLLFGGTGTTGTQLTLQTTSGNGTTDSFAFNGGNNGGTNFGNWNLSGLNVAVGGFSVSNGNIQTLTATKTLVLKQGANGAVGTFICTGGGTITITNSNVAISDFIGISLNTAGGTITTPPAMKTITGSTGFQTLCGATDTSTYNYAIIKNSP